LEMKLSHMVQEIKRGDIYSWVVIKAPYCV
jgi:hypothetical protein